MIKLNNPGDWLWLILFVVTAMALFIFALRNRSVRRMVKLGFVNALVAAIILYVIHEFGLNIPINIANVAVLTLLGIPGLGVLLAIHRMI